MSSSSGSSLGTIDYPSTPDDNGSVASNGGYPTPGWISPDPPTPVIGTFDQAWAAPETCTCNCCCRTDGRPTYGATPGGDRVGRLAELNDETLLHHGSNDRLPDDAVFLGPCGRPEHSVCVRCVRSALASHHGPPGELRCLGMGGDCQHTYGDGLRWCMFWYEWAARTGATAHVSVRCNCGAPVRRSLHLSEHSTPGRNFQECSACETTMCFDCGRSTLPDGCARCAGGGGPLTRSRVFPEVCQWAVTAEMVTERATTILADRGGHVRCDKCGANLQREEGCKYVTHCGTEVCSECNARGCSTTGIMCRHDCCRGTCQLAEPSRPIGRIALSLFQLFSSSPSDVRRDAVVAIGRGQLTQMVAAH